MGFVMPEVEGPREGVHTLLIPRRPRLSVDEESDGIDPRGVTTKDLRDASPRPLLFWDSLIHREVTPNESRRCLWDLIDLVAIPSESFPEEYIRFTERWGTLDSGQYVDYSLGLDDPQFGDPVELLRWANQTHSLLLTLLGTEAGELVDERVLLDLREGDAEEWDALATMPFEDIDRIEELQLERWRSKRAAGQGLDLQRALVSMLVTTHYLGSNDSQAEWDSKGRRAQSVARGVREIIGTHVSAIFLSPQIGIFSCSVCGKPFEFAEEEGKRRPRRGAQRFCSEACRLVGRRASNLRSWNRNKARWLAKYSGGDAEES